MVQPPLYRFSRWLLPQIPTNELLALLAHLNLLRKTILQLPHLLKYPRLWTPSERRIPLNQLVRQHPHIPQISLLTVRLLSRHLRRYIIQCPTQYLHLFLPLRRPPKIAYLHHILPRQNYILRLYVPVRYLLLMQVLQSLKNLSHYHFAFRFRTFEPLHQQWPMNVLHQNEDVKIICKRFVRFDNVGMVNLLEYLQLSQQLIFHAILVNNGLEYFF